MPSLEWTCEAAVRLLLLASPAFAGSDIRHYDNDSKALLDTVILQGVLGNKRLDGICGFDVTVSAILASATLTDDELDTKAKAIVEALYSPLLTAEQLRTALPNLEWLSLETDTTTDRQPNRKSRKRRVSFPFIAKLIGSP